MDELEISKIFGAGCAALLAFVGFGQLGSTVVGVDQLDTPAYVIEVAEAEDHGGDDAAEVVAMPIAQVMAMADIEQGAKVFKKCSSCHKVVDGNAHALGPDLYGVVGRDIAGAGGYDYSDALMAKEGPWDFAALNGFLEAPKKWAKGTKMGYNGLSKPEDRASVIAWLNEQGDAPMPMPVAMEAAEAPSEPDVTAAAAVVESVGGVGLKDEKEDVAIAVVNVEEEAAAAPVEEKTEVAEIAPEPAPEVEKAPEPAKAAEVEEEVEVVMAEPEKAEEPAPAVVPAPEPEVAAAAAPAAVVVAGGDLKLGAKVFRKCKACHKAKEGAGHGVGPNLHGVVGRKIASIDGFKYSDALMGKDGVWDAAALDGFLLKPKEWAKGTKMSFSGLRKEADRAAVIAWLAAQAQ